MGTVANVIVGVATLEIRYPIGGSFTQVGYTEDGVTVSYEPTFQFIEVEEEVNPIKVEIRHMPPSEKDVPQVKNKERDKSFFPVFHEEVCAECDTCIIQCPEGAITKTENGYVVNYEKCTGCLLCKEACPYGGIQTENSKNFLSSVTPAKENFSVLNGVRRKPLSR
jgi:Fe-S-cluster-containing hydrogenase component 2